ncbi:hypothetical protein [Peptoclostridium litorale]|uniref:hypothetical protein n=1 Tax=Peptoclostridium litorale TaxID=1557 RepID=UPI001A9A4147|nr:hypothetical protein [Peptoclostridium litorale]
MKFNKNLIFVLASVNKGVLSYKISRDIDNIHMDISLSRLTKYAFGHKILIVKTSDRRVGNGGIYYEK